MKSTPTYHNAARPSSRRTCLRDGCSSWGRHRAAVPTTLAKTYWRLGVPDRITP